MILYLRQVGGKLIKISNCLKKLDSQGYEFSIHPTWEHTYVSMQIVAKSSYKGAQVNPTLVHNKWSGFK